ncbi:MAG: hypothetical protein ACFFDI_03940, partial [Promethearchaeota archaeon]
MLIRTTGCIKLKGKNFLSILLSLLIIFSSPFIGVFGIPIANSVKHQHQTSEGTPAKLKTAVGTWTTTEVVSTESTSDSE